MKRVADIFCTCCILMCACWCNTAGGEIPSPPTSIHDIRWKQFESSSEVYIDTTLQFTAAENMAPDIDVTKNKLALWLNIETKDGVSTTNLCVYSSLADLAPSPKQKLPGMIVGARGAVTAVKPHVFKLAGTQTLRPGNWYRLTVRTIKDVTRRAANTGNPARSLLGFQIYLDGTLLAAEESSFSKAYAIYAAGTEGWLNAKRDKALLDFLTSGTVFLSLTGESENSTIESVGFRGSGDHGEVQVSADAPTFPGISSLDFILSFQDDESVVKSIANEAWTCPPAKKNEKKLKTPLRNL